ncbi:MAG: cobaltochelatase subunit CobN [Deltaproteobacteria bacterium]|nr:cobaltochelatase subunit CobN [Deltaproteobacteria bacterium]
MAWNKRFLVVILNACFILILTVPANAGALTKKKLAFLIPETSTKVMAEGISKFKEEYPAPAKKVDVVVYPGRDLEEKSVEPDLSDADVIFLCHLNYKVMLDMENDLKIARSRGAKVIGLGGHDVFRVKGYYNVDVATYPEMVAYWEYSGPENVKRLIAYLLREFAGMADITIEPPIEMPLEGIYHPDAPGSKVFETLESYLEWYKKSGHLKDASWVGLLAYNTLKANDNMVEKAIIRQLEKEGLNVICTIGYPADEMFQKYLLTKDGTPQVDIIVSLMFSHPKEKSVELLANANIPIIPNNSLHGNTATDYFLK